MEEKQSILIKIVGLYLLFSLLWVTAGDFILFTLLPDNLNLELSLIKGWIFVILSSLLLFVFLRYFMNQLDIVEDDLDTTQETLATMTKNLVFMVEHLPVIFLRIDSEGYITKLYGSGVENLLHSRDEIIGSNLFNTFQEFPEVVTNADKALSGLSSIWQMEVNDRTYDFVYEPIHEDGKVIGAIGFGMNVTELKIMKEDLLQTKTELTSVRQSLLALQRMELLGTTVSRLSHELNNQFTAILGYLDIAISELEDPPESLLYAKKLSLQTAKLPEHLLSYSRSKGKGVETSNVNDVIENIYPIITRIVDDNIDIVYDLDPDIDEIQISPIELESILTNLISNAADAIENHGSIRIEISKSKSPNTLQGDLIGEFICISVTDTGSGINPNIVSNIFEPLYTTKEQGKGTGLGLSIIHEIVTGVGGGIQVESDSAGSTFNIYIPIKIDGDIDDVDSNPPTTFTKPKNLSHIIILDDNTPVVEIEKSVLDNYATIDTFEAPTEVIDSVTRGSVPDLLIMEMVISGMNLEQFVTIFRKESPDCPILMITGYSRFQSTANQISNCWFLAKPFTPQQLLNKISQIFP